ncbi:MAG: SAP domain-containing protein [Candidatus Kryptoniota bacterium]
MNRIKLSKSMTEGQFENGYWYADEIKGFAKEIGIPSFSKLRKDEIEKLIKHFLRTGETKSPSRKISSNRDVRDTQIGLKIDLPIINYTNNKETKEFILKEAFKIDPKLKRKSGAGYWLNRWREEQTSQGMKMTYGDLVRQYVKLNQPDYSFPQIPSTKFNNFISIFLALEKHSTRDEALKAWEELKEFNIPKNYKAWKKYKLAKKAH